VLHLPKSLTALVLLLVLCLQAGLAVHSMRGKSTTYDEPTHMAYGTRGLVQGTFHRDRGSFDATMPVSVLNALAAGKAGAEGEKPSRREKLFAARLPTVALALALTLVVFLWATELFDRRAGLLAALLCALSPNVLAHGRLVTTDVPLALGIFAATYTFWRFHQRPSKGRLAVAALAFGLAQLTKVTAIFLLPIFVLILVFRAWRERKEAGEGEIMRKSLQGLGVIAALCLGAVVVVNVGFGGEGIFTSLEEMKFRSARFQALQEAPVLGGLPLPAPTPYIEGLDLVARDLDRDRWTYCLGNYHPRGVWYYYLVGFALKMPPALFLLLAIAAWLALTGRVRAPGGGAFLITPVVFLAVYLSLFNQYQIGFRHMLPTLPFLFVGASRVALWKPKKPALQFVAPVLVGAFALSTALIHPHYLAYFNGLAGGPEQGWRFLIDSNLDWGQDKAAARHRYPKESEKRVTIEPGAPMVGRLVVSVNRLVGLKPHQKEAYAWLRENFEPVDSVGYSWHVYDVTQEALDACCADAFEPLRDKKGNLASEGRPIGGGDGVTMARLEKLTDGSLGAGAFVDAVVSEPVLRQPFGAWFGVDWENEEREVARLLAYPVLAKRGPTAGRFLASDFVVEFWDGEAWQEVPGTRRENNQDLEVDLRFSPLRTSRLRLRILKTRNHRGLVAERGRFHAACLEFAAYGADSESAVPDRPDSEAMIDLAGRGEEE